MKPEECDGKQFEYRCVKIYKDFKQTSRKKETAFEETPGKPEIREGQFEEAWQLGKGLLDASAKEENKLKARQGLRR